MAQVRNIEINRHSTILVDPGVPVTFTLHSYGSYAFGMCKCVKNVTQWGLKESKDFIDYARDGHSPSIVMNMTPTEIIKFKKDLIELCSDAKYTLSDLQNLRTAKLAKLGFYDEESLLEMLIQKDILSIKLEYDQVKKLLEERYSKLPIEYIKNILEIE